MGQLLPSLRWPAHLRSLWVTTEDDAITKSEFLTRVLQTKFVGKASKAALGRLSRVFTLVHFRGASPASGVEGLGTLDPGARRLCILSTTAIADRTAARPESTTGRAPHLNAY